MCRVAILAVLATGCFAKPERPAASDAGIDARTCPTLGDDFESQSVNPCGTWGGPQGTGTLERTNGKLQTTVAAGQSAGCVSAGINFASGIWLEIDATPAPLDETTFMLAIGTRQVIFDIRPSPPTPTYQGRGSSGVVATPSTTQVYVPSVMRFWRFTRGEDSSLYKGIDLAYSMDGIAYETVMRFGVSGPEFDTVTPHFTVTGSNNSPSHPSTVFDNYNAPCMLGP